MNIPSCFFTCFAFAIVGIIIAVINMLTAQSHAMRGGSFARFFVVHIIAGLCYVISAFGMIGFGITWIVTYFKD